MDGVTNLQVKYWKQPPSEKQNGFANTLVGQQNNSKPHLNHNRDERDDIDGDDRIRREWMLVAMVLDRVFLFLFLMVTMLITLIVLIDHP